MQDFIMKLAVLAACLMAVTAECPNACSSHGKCGAYDACVCYRNWMSNDCSERMCQFGLAHVDTPLGDLDSSSGYLTGPDVQVVAGDAMYPYGTQEQYPDISNSDGTTIDNSAHAYRECSNKGICDRSSGTCTCFEGYDGSACQRASCPTSANGMCSGHGTCKSIQELALEDHGNVYRLWDEDVTMGCDCDAGYTAADCSQRVCKYGADPLYYDDFQNVRHANFTLQFYMSSAAYQAYGNYSLIFTDVYGEDWETDPIDINADCGVMQDRLEGLPNDVIPTGSVLCYRSEEAGHVAASDSLDGQEVPTAVTGFSDYAEEGMIYDADMLIIARYILAFPGNPGVIAPLKVNKYLDGARPTLTTTESAAVASSLGWHIFPNGYIGEDIDYVNDECEGVLVTLNDDTSTKFQGYLGGLSTEEIKLLKKCLGDGNGITSDNIEVYNWDYGSYTNPHLIKLVDATQDTYTEYVRADGSSYKIKDVNLDASNLYQNTADADYPVSLLCNNGKEWVLSKGALSLDWYLNRAVTGSYYGEYGWCKALNPPGFYAIIYFDDCSTDGVTYLTNGAATDSDLTCDTTATGGAFRIISRPGGDFASTTEFHVYTTQGTLQQVSQHAGIYTNVEYNAATPNPAKYSNYHSNVVHFSNDTVLTEVAATFGIQGALDCESQTTGSSGNGALDCITYGDRLFFLNLGNKDTSSCNAGTSNAGVTYTAANQMSCGYTPDAVSYASNPRYLNMYTVKKISLEPQSYANADYTSQVDNAQDDGGIDWEGYRREMTLDYGLNANYQRRFTTDTESNALASVYKFYPPTLATTGTTGQTMVAECSNRGLCDTETGLCECFAGYSGDNCGSVSELVR